MKNKIIIILTICFVFVFTACGKEQNQKEKTTDEVGGNVINIYYPEGAGIAVDKQGYQIKQPDSLTASVEEVMSAFSERLGSDIIAYHTYMIDADNDVTLEFLLVKDYEKEYFLLARAAVVKTLFQIDDIEKITIMLSDKEGQPVVNESYDRNSFYYYGYDEAEE